MVLVAIVAVALAGRTGATADTQRNPDPAVAVASRGPAAASLATPVPTPSRRSDWPAAIGERTPATHLPRQPREEGTDGLMGGLPFGIPGDTPTVHLDRVNRFTIDDVQAPVWRPDGTPTWVRGAGGPPIVSADPMVR